MMFARVLRTSPPLPYLLTGLLTLGLGCVTTPEGSLLVRDTFNAPRSVLQVAWSRALIPKIPLFQYQPQEFASATVAQDGVVYIGSSAKRLFALRPDGSEVWDPREFTGGISAEPLYLPKGQARAEALLIVGDDDGALTALAADTGKTLWTYRVRGTIRSRPTFADGFIYFTSGEGKLYAVDAKTGAWRWQHDREVPETFAIRGTSGVLADKGRVYSGFPDGSVVALNGQSGETVWMRQLSGDATRFTDVDGTPVLQGGVLYVSSHAGGVYALEEKDGSTRWRFELEGAGPLNVADGRIYAVAARAGLYCLDEQGHLVWRQALANQGELSQPTIFGPYLLLSAARGGSLVIDGASGRLLQSFDPGHGVSGRPIAAGKNVYVLSNAGVFYALHTS